MVLYVLLPSTALGYHGLKRVVVPIETSPAHFSLFYSIYIYIYLLRKNA